MDYEDFIEQATMREVALVVKQKIHDDKDHYRMISYAFRVGYISAKNGKDIEMFPEDKKAKTGTISQEEKENTFTELQARLGGA